MSVQDRHDSYLLGSMTNEETELYETEVATQRDTAEELRERLHAKGAWDPQMVTRARALINVSEAYFAMEGKPEDDVRAETARLNLLPLEEQAVDLAAYEGAAEPPAWGGADEVLDAVLTRAFELQSRRVELHLRGDEARLWYSTAEQTVPEALPSGAAGSEIEACLLRLAGLHDPPAAPVRRGPVRRRVGERTCELTVGVERLGDDRLFVLDLAVPDAY